MWYLRFTRRKTLSSSLALKVAVCCQGFASSRRFADRKNWFRMTVRPFDAWSAMSKLQNSSFDTGHTLTILASSSFSYHDRDSSVHSASTRGRSKGNTSPSHCTAGHTNSQRFKSRNGKRSRRFAREILFQRNWADSSSSNYPNLYTCPENKRQSRGNFAHYSDHAVLRRRLACISPGINHYSRSHSETKIHNSTRPLSSFGASIGIDKTEDSHPLFASSIGSGFLEKGRRNYTWLGVERTHRLRRKRVAEDTTGRL